MKVKQKYMNKKKDILMKGLYQVSNRKHAHIAELLRRCRNFWCKNDKTGEVHGLVVPAILLVFHSQLNSFSGRSDILGFGDDFRH